MGWVVEALACGPDVVAALRPGGPLPVRVRVHLAGCVLDTSRRSTGGARAATGRAGATGEAPLVGWIVDGRRAYVGPAPAGAALDALAAFAEMSATAAAPVDATTLEVTAGPGTARAARGIVAVTRLGDLVERSARSVVGRVVGTRPRELTRAVAETALVVPALPLVPWAFGSGLVSRVAAAAAPRVPAVSVDGGDGSSLVAHVLAEAVPDLLGHALVRTVLLLSPVPVVIAVRLHGTAASICVGRGRVDVTEGVRPDAIAVIDGSLDSLVDVAVASVTRQLRGGASG